jgi:hypothetical protein
LTALADPRLPAATVAAGEPIVLALRRARALVERLRLVPDGLGEAEGRELVALLDAAEVLRHGELAEREMMAVPAARGPRTSW